jgi:hypothetical protein
MSSPKLRVLVTAALLAGFTVNSSIAQDPPATPGCRAPGSQDLIGLWESRDVSRGGIGHTIEFRHHGTYVEAPTVIINSTYRVSGDQLFVDTPGAPREQSKIRIEGDTLTQTLHDGSSLPKVRVGQAETGSSPIVGTWRYGAMLGTGAFEKYTADGRMLFRLPLRSSTGCYQIEGDRLLLSKPISGETAFTFNLPAGGELILKSSSRNPKSYPYKKSEDGLWYEREHAVHR